MEELLNKLTEEQKTELSNLCQKINQKFQALSLSNESFDDFVFWGDMLLNDFDDVDKYVGTSLQKGIYQVMNELGLWCTI